MLEKSMYDSWVSLIRLLIKGKKHGRMMLDSIDNGPLVYLTVEEKGQTRPKKYPELTEAQQLQDDCDFQATNIILHCLPPDVYALVNHQKAAKDIWDRVKLLMKGTELSYQERECRLFSQLINDMHTIGMTMQQVQVNTKFLNALPSEWSMFVTDVKLAKSLYTTNYDQLYAYLSQHERHANEFLTQHSQSDFPQLDSCLAVPTFQQGEDPIECINKAMAFLSAVESRVIVQQVQGRQSSSFVGTGNRGIAITLRGNYAAVAQQTIPQNSAFQTEDLDAYDSDCDDLSLAKAILMENLSSCDPDVLSEVQYFDSYLNDMINQDVQEMQYSEQTHIDYFQENKIHSDSNIIPYSQYMQESQDAVIHDTNSSAPNDLLVLSLVEQMTNHVAHLDKENQTNKMRIQPTLYDGGVIAIEHAVISVIDDEETLILEEDCDQRCLAKEVAANKENDEVNVVEEVVKVINTTKLIVDDAQVSAAGNVVSTASAATTISAANKENDKVNVAEEVVEVINTAKLIVDDAQVSAVGNVVSTASAATTVSAATTTTDDVDDITLAQALAEIKSTKPKMKRVIIQELGESITKISSQQSQDKITKLDLMKKKDLQEKKAEKKTQGTRRVVCWKKQAIYVNNSLEKEESIFHLKENEEKKKQTKQLKIRQRKIIAFKRVNTFEDFRTELVEGKEKRAGIELIQENAKKQKVEDNKEIVELKQCLEIIPDEEEIIIDAIPLAVKSPSIVGWKIHKEGRKSYYQIMRADGKSQMYMIFSHMLKSFNREDLEDLYKLVKAKYESTRPVEDLDLLLWGDLKTMFEPHVEDKIYMLVENKYPLAPLTLSMMLEKKLIIDYESEMAYQLLKFIIKHAKFK
ncbi:hypothetical protein Tco_0277085 [Tanacetum coccineum]